MRESATLSDCKDMRLHLTAGRYDQMTSTVCLQLEVRARQYFDFGYGSDGGFVVREGLKHFHVACVVDYSQQSIFRPGY